MSADEASEETNDIFTVLIGGEAGQGIKKAGSVAAALFRRYKRYIFQMDDYQSLIRGGHNFSVVTSGSEPVYSHYLSADLVVALDEPSYHRHMDHCAEDGLVVVNSDAMSDDLEAKSENERESDTPTIIALPLTAEARAFPDHNRRLGVGAVAALAGMLDAGHDALEQLVRDEYPADLENNVQYALLVYDLMQEALGEGTIALASGDATGSMLSGNEAIALGAAAAGLQCYVAYPMTPASTLLHFFAKHAKALGIGVMHPENEIAVANIAIGAAAAGARSMIGSSGGGVALMGEAISLAGMTETPLLVYLGSRTGPSTGVPTYTEQADLRFALNQGHGDFPRLVASPGTVEEAFRVAAELLELAWHFQLPALLLTEKHLAESTMHIDLTSELDNVPWAMVETEGEVEDTPASEAGSTERYARYRDTSSGISPLAVWPSDEPIKINSYEHDETGITTEAAEMITQMHDKRQRKQNTLEIHLRGMDTVNRFGDDMNDTVVLCYGSTAMSVREAVAAADLDVALVQPIYLEPLPVWELEQYREKKIVVVEQSASHQFATLLLEKAGLRADAVITRYDGRPFEPHELADELAEAV